MSLRKVFQKAAVTTFKAFGDVPVSCVYISETDNGFDSPARREYPTTVIWEETKGRESFRYSFSELIQVTDKVGLIPTLKLSVPIVDGDKIRDEKGETYTIVAHDIDPAEALWAVLLRKV